MDGLNILPPSRDLLIASGDVGDGVMGSRLRGNDGPSLVYSPHPLMPAVERETIYVPVVAGETIAAYLTRLGLTARMGRRPVVVTIDGYRVPREMWAHCRPRAGKLIHVQAVVEKGGGKNPIAMVLSIALMVFAPYAAVGLIGAEAAAATVIGSITMGQIVGGAISLIGGMVINSLFPPPKPALSSAQGQGFAAESPTYSLSGGGNRARPYEPMPVIMGNHRVFPDAGAKTYTEFEGEDQYLYQVFDFGYNDVVLSEFKIGQTPIGDYTGVTMQESDGSGVLTLFPANVDTIAGGAVTYAGGAITRTSSPDATALAVEFTGSLFNVGPTGVIGLQGVSIRLEYRAVGSGSWLPFVDSGSDFEITSASRKPLRQTYWRQVAAGQYEVQVTRLSADSADAQIVSELVWSQLRTYQPDTADYIGRKRLALKIKASGQLNGMVAQLNCIARAKCLAWNGSSWVSTNNSNPAWWYLAWARGTFAGGRRVWGGGIADARIDLEALKSFGAWCDSKALSFNGVFDQPQSVFDGLSSIALMGRGTVSWGGGKLSVVWDAPALPVVAVFGMSNIQAGSFAIDYATEQLADEIIVNFINPDLDWQRDTLRVAVPGAANPPVRSRPVDLFGCTNKDMAGRNGNLYAANNAYRTRKYKWRSDFEAMPAARGDVVQLSHDLASLDYSGRFIEGGNTTTLKLERAVPLVAGGSFVVIVKPDQTFATYTVTGGAGDTDTLTLTSPLGFNPWADAGHPPYDYKWLYGATATPGKKVKIDSIRPLDERTVELTAVDERTEYYASEASGYTYVQPRPVFGGMPQISNLQITEEGVRAGQGYLARVVLTWEAGADYGFADISASVGGAPMRIMGYEVRDRSFEFDITDDQDVEVSVTAYGTLGRLGLSATMTASKHVFFAALAKPLPVENFAISGGVFSWSESVEPDVIGWSIRFHYGGTRFTWDDAAPLHEGLITDSPWRPISIPSGPVVFLICARDAAGLDGETPAAIITDLGDPDVANVLESFDLKALGFPGTTVNGAISGGNLEADDASGLFWSGGDAAPFWGTDGNAFWSATVYKEMTYEATVSPTAADADSTMTIDHTIAGDPFTIEYRRQGPGAFWSGDDGAAFWSADGNTFWSAPPGYVAWPGAIMALNEPYDIRIITGAGATRGVISELTVNIDVPDIEETFDDIVIDAAGTRLPITLSYRLITNVQATVQSDGNGAVGVRIEDKNAALGPLLKTINDAGAAVAGLLDARIKGY